jgi:hypothetical protein
MVTFLDLMIIWLSLVYLIIAFFMIVTKLDEQE